MADNFGALELPASTTDAVLGDPGLTKLAAFLAAVINAEVADAWALAQPFPTSAQVPAVKTVYAHDWNGFGFNENALPALFVWREKGKQEQLGEDWRSDVTAFHVLWALPAIAQEEQRARQPIINAVMKAIGTFIEEGRHPAWVDPLDAWPSGLESSAPTIPADAQAFVLPHATTLAPHTFTGAGLNGTIGAAAMSPRRVPTVTLASAPSGTYSTTAPFVFTAIDWTGTTVTESVTPTSSSGGQTLTLLNDYQEIVSILEPAQLTTAGHIQHGVTVRTGYGSCIRDRARFDIMLTEDWQVVRVDHHVLDGDQLATERLPHHAVFGIVNVRESYAPDLTLLPAAKAASSFYESGLLVDQSLFT
jgi:hypothetical protein